MRRSFRDARDYAHENSFAVHHFKITQKFQVGVTIGIDLGDIWSHYCTLSEDGEVVAEAVFRTNPSGVGKRFRDLGPARVAMEAGTHSIWVSEQIRELGHEVIVANVRELARRLARCDQDFRSLRKGQWSDLVEGAQRGSVR